MVVLLSSLAAGNNKDRLATFSANRSSKGKKPSVVRQKNLKNKI